MQHCVEIWGTKKIDTRGKKSYSVSTFMFLLLQKREDKRRNVNEKGENI